jgi:hypothetical protein
MCLLWPITQQQLGHSFLNQINHQLWIYHHHDVTFIGWLPKSGARSERSQEHRTSAQGLLLDLSLSLSLPHLS